LHLEAPFKVERGQSYEFFLLPAALIGTCSYETSLEVSSEALLLTYTPDSGRVSFSIGEYDPDQTITVITRIDHEDITNTFEETIEIKVMSPI
jgi:hypothetical protein